MQIQTLRRAAIRRLKAPSRRCSVLNPCVVLRKGVDRQTRKLAGFYHHIGDRPAIRLFWVWLGPHRERRARQHKRSPDRQATGAELAKPPFGATMRLGWRGQWLRSRQSLKAGNHFAGRFVICRKCKSENFVENSRFPTSEPCPYLVVRWAQAAGQTRGSVTDEPWRAGEGGEPSL